MYLPGPDLIQSNHVFNAEPSFPITLDCHTNGELLGGGKLDILLDTGASKSYMSKAFYIFIFYFLFHIFIYIFSQLQDIYR